MVFLKLIRNDCLSVWCDLYKSRTFNNVVLFLTSHNNPLTLAIYDCECNCTVGWNIAAKLQCLCMFGCDTKENGCSPCCIVSIGSLGAAEFLS